MSLHCLVYIVSDMCHSLHITCLFFFFSLLAALKNFFCFVFVFVLFFVFFTDFKLFRYNVSWCGSLHLSCA